MNDQYKRLGPAERGDRIPNNWRWRVWYRPDSRKRLGGWRIGRADKPGSVLYIYGTLEEAGRQIDELIQRDRRDALRKFPPVRNIADISMAEKYESFRRL